MSQDKEYLLDILEAARLAVAYMSGKGQEELVRTGALGMEEKL